MLAAEPEGPFRLSQVTGRMHWDEGGFGNAPRSALLLLVSSLLVDPNGSLRPAPGYHGNSILPPL